MSSLTVTVTDQTGALIPGAQVTVTNPASGLRFEAMADKNGPAIGQATLNLDSGRYLLRVHATGFKSWEEKDIEVGADTRRTVVLAISNDQAFCSPCINPLGFIEEEHPQLMVELPLMPMQQFVPPAKRLRPWFHLF